jgi:hypothetical protein
MKGPTAPPPAPPPAPMPVPDTEDPTLKTAARRKQAERAMRSGRASTILSEGSETLG